MRKSVAKTVAAVCNIVVKKTVATKPEPAPDTCTNCDASGLRCSACGTNMV